MRVRLDLAYDGSGFAGWARQPGLRTVAGEVERALALVLRLPEPPATVVAGRTDAGVHATGQVCHVDLPAAAWAGAAPRAGGGPGEGLRRRLGGVLPDDVVVRRASLAPDGFDARFGALRRHYAYTVTDDPSGPPPLRRHDVVAVRAGPGGLDVGAMADAAALLRGLHDFAAYCRPREGASTVRTLQRFTWRRTEDAGGADGAALVVADVTADAFCHSMVRALVGAVLEVGRGRRPTGWPRAVLDAGRRDGAVPVAPAHGLVLRGVDYPPPHLLAARAATARARRSSAGAAARARAWEPRGMSESPTSGTQYSSDVPDPALLEGGRAPQDETIDEPEVSDVAAEPQATDGVMYMADRQDDRVSDREHDEGFSPDEREHHVGRFGMTAEEEYQGETLEERLKEEEPDVPVGSGGAYGAGSGELAADLPEDGELLDDEVGYARAGRLVEPDAGAGTDTEKSLVAGDAGLAGGAASAEEAAMHVVGEEEDEAV